MRRELQITLVLITAGTWLVTALVLGLPNTWWGAIRPFLSALTVASFAVWLYESKLWSLPALHKRLTFQPDFSGVWKVTLHSTYIDPTTTLRISPIEGFAQIDQSASTFCLRIYTPKSKSKTIAYAFALDQNVYSLAIVYQNDPAIDLRENGSPAHRGSAVFEARGQRPSSFSGDYWTERKTTGTLNLTDRRKGEISSFKEGMELFSS